MEKNDLSPHQEEAIERIRKACERDGIAPKVIEDVVSSTRTALLQGNVLKSAMNKAFGL